MTHEEMRDRLLDLAYGELAPREAREVEEHAASCEACGAELARIRGTRALMAALPQEPAPAAGERILVAAAREAVRRRERPRWAPRMLWAASLAAAAVAVVGVSYQLLALRPGPIGREDPRALMGDSPYAREAQERAARDAVEPKGGLAALGAAPETPAGAGLKGDVDRAPQDRAQPAPEAKKNEAPRTSSHPPSPPRRYAEPPPPEAEAPVRAAPAPAPPRAPAPPAATAAPERSRAEDRAERRAAAPPRSERVMSAPAPAQDAETAPAPAAPPSAAEDRAEPMAGAARPSAGARASKAAAPAAPAGVMGYDDLRRTGRLRGEVRTFPGCEGESWRKIERDPDGRVVSYAREGLLGDRRVRVEVVYDADGVPERVTVKDLATSATLTGTDAWIPSPAEADGPPRCER